jgi:tripartite-type tricarboxylate transporter receptor subunit TctC
MKAQPDGYTLIVEGNSFWISPLLQKKPYEVLRDFTPVTIVLSAPNIVVVHPSVAANSISELIALAKAKPGQLNFGSSGTGSSQQLAMEMLKSMAGVNMVHVPYKGVGPAVTSLIGGEIQIVAASASSVAPFIKSGKLKALAVTTAQPSPLFPALPTIASAGLPGYELGTRTGLLAAGSPPKTIINRLNQEIVRALNTTEMKEKFFNAGVETVGNTPEEFVAVIKSEISRMGQVIKAAGIKAD